MKKFFFLLLTLLPLVGCDEQAVNSTAEITAPVSTTTQLTLDISEKLKQTICEQMGLRSEELSDDDFKQISEFTIQEDDPTLHVALQAMTNLKSLVISVPIKNLSIIHSLTTLQHLTITDSPLYHLDFSSLTHLKGLTLINNNLEKINNLSALKNVESLAIIDNEVQDLTPLQQLSSLKHLDITNNAVTSIQSIQNLESLTIFIAANNSIQDIHTTSFENLSNLTNLSLSSNPIDSIDFVKHLPHLEVLQIAHTNVSDLSPLTHLTHLMNVDIRETNVTSIQPLLPLKQLKFLYLTKEQVTDWTLLQNRHGLIISESIMQAQ